MLKALLGAAICIAAASGCRRAPPPAVVLTSTRPETLLLYGSTIPSGAAATGIAAMPSGGLTYEVTAGTYRGRSELIRDGGRCSRGGKATFAMRDTAVRFRVDRSVPELVAPVALDGFFMADNGASVIRGGFTPCRVDFDAGTVRCGYRYSLTKT